MSTCQNAIGVAVCSAENPPCHGVITTSLKSNGGIRSTMLLPVTNGFLVPFRRASRLANIVDRRDHTAVRVFPCEVHLPFKLAHNVLTQHMFDLFGIFVHVVHG